LKKYIPLQIRAGNYSLEPNRKVNIHLFIDGSVVEGFINDKDAFTTRVFPKKENSDEVELFTEGSNLHLLGASVWQLNSSHNKTDF
jgi:beta-fructofuranosidase